MIGGLEIRAHNGRNLVLFWSVGKRQSHGGSLALGVQREVWDVAELVYVDNSNVFIEGSE